MGLTAGGTFQDGKARLDLTDEKDGEQRFYRLRGPEASAVPGVPVMWIPHSYGGCGQHGPDEHGLGTLFRDGLGLMAGVFWDLGEA